MKQELPVDFRYVEPGELIESLQSALKIIEKASSFISRLEKEPRLVLSRYKEYLQDVSSLPVEAIALNDSEMNTGKKAISRHEFQIYLAERANDALQQYRREKNISNEYQIELINPMHYPSRCRIIRGDGSEVLRFNFIERYFGVIQKRKPEDIRKDIEREKRDILEEEVELIKLGTFLKNPYLRARNFQDTIFVLLNRKKVIEMFRLQKGKREANVAHMRRNIELLLEEEKELKQKMRSHQESLEELMAFFNEMGYKRLKDNDYDLY